MYSTCFRNVESGLIAIREVLEPRTGFVGSPIFSIDVHPSGMRFVTSGSDNKAKVWNLLPLLQVGVDLTAKCKLLPNLLAFCQHATIYHAVLLYAKRSLKFEFLGATGAAGAEQAMRAPARHID